MPFNMTSNAVLKGDIQYVKRCFEKNSDTINHQDEGGRTPLLLAVCTVNVAMVELLIKKGADVHVGDSKGDIPLHVACYNGHTNIVKVLLEQSIDQLNVRNSGRHTPLNLACCNGHTETVNVLLEQLTVDVLVSDINGDTPLHVACLEGHTGIVKVLLEQPRIDVGVKNINGNTPLHVACLKRHTDIVKVLLEQPTVDVRVRNNNGETPLHVACLKGHTAIVKVLLELSTADVNVVDNNGDSPLHVTCYNGHTDTVKVLLEQATCDVNVGNKYDNTPLYVACLKGCTSIVKVLLQRPTLDVNVVNKDGTTPLHVAYSEGHTDIIKVLLVQSTLDVNVVNKDGDTPLHLAVLWQYYDVVALMLSQDHQVQMEKKNSLQQTPFLHAVSGGDFELIHTLVSNGADINAVDADGNNCLHLALETKKFHSRGEYLDVLDEFCSTLGLSKEYSLSPKVVASYLANQGADLYHRNQNNKTPLDLIGDPVFKEKLVFFSPQVKCTFCDENQATVNLYPCGHNMTCEECCSKIKLKKCPQCRQPRTRKSGFESPQLEVREPTKAAKQVGVKRKQVESPQLEVREPTKAAKQVGVKRKQVESPQLEVREPTKAAKQVGVKRKQVGRLLGISYDILDIIREDNQPDTVEQAYQMLLKWTQICEPEKRTVDVLRDALQEAECHEVIKHLPSDEKWI